MKSIFKKTAILICISTVLCLFGGCEPLIGTKTPGKYPDPIEGNYDNFQNGITTYLRNYDALNDVVLANLDAAQIESQVEGEQLVLYENLRLLLMLSELEVLNLYDFDLLTTTALNYDRAEGTIASTGHYGYKLKQTSKLKFGSDSYSEGGTFIQSAELSATNAYLDMTSTEKLSEYIDSRIMLEIELFDKNSYVMRYIVCVVDSEKMSTTTKMVCVILRDDKAQFAYYEGNASVASIIKLDDHVELTMDALTFNTGYDISFDVEIK